MPTARTKINRKPARAAYDRRVIDAILDEARVCHLGVIDGGHPVVTPTLHARIGDWLYVHGSAASRTLKVALAGGDVCLTATLFDGLVLARSAFHHSANYRSVTVFARPEEVAEAEEKLRALEAFVEKLMPGRWADVRPPTCNELHGTRVVRLALTEASAKTRSGPPVDDAADADLPVWAGVLPARLTFAQPERDPQLPASIEPPRYLDATHRRRPRPG